MISVSENVAIDISKFVRESRENMRAFAIIFIQDLAQRVVEATPVKTGFLRASWHAALNNPSSLPAPGSSDVSSVALTASQLQIGDIFYYVNNAEYAGYLEYGTVHIAPRAFVRGVVNEAEAIAQAAARKVRNGSLGGSGGGFSGQRRDPLTGRFTK